MLFRSADISEYVNSSTAPIPEPETYALMLAGLGVVAWMRRRNERQRHTR